MKCYKLLLIKLLQLWFYLMFFQIY